MAQSNITGVEELQRMITQLGRAPAKAITSAAKKGANIVRNAAKNAAPKKTGALIRGIKIFSEKRKVGKKVYWVTFDRKYNNVFGKISRSGKRSYYPSSQEYGWKQNGGRKIEGKFFMLKAIRLNRQRAEQKMVDELANSLREMGG